MFWELGNWRGQAWFQGGVLYISVFYPNPHPQEQYTPLLKILAVKGSQLLSSLNIAFSHREVPRSRLCLIPGVACGQNLAVEGLQKLAPMGDNPGGTSHCRAPLGTQRQTHFRQPFPSTKSTFLTFAHCVFQEYLQ